MNRSPAIRFIAAALLIVFIVVATFMYGNAQRAEQQQSREQAKVTEVQKQSEQKREDKKSQNNEATKTLPVESLTPTAPQTPPSVPVTPAPVTKIPSTGNAGQLSFLLASIVLPALTLLARRKRPLAI